MIRFSAALVVVAIGLLGDGFITSKLTLVYIAIAVSAGALVTLAIGVVLNRAELFGDGHVLAPADAGASTASSAPAQSAPSQPVSPFPGSTVPPRAQPDPGADGGGWDRTGRDRFGQPSFGQPPTRQSAYGSAVFEAAAFSSDAAGGVTGGDDSGRRHEGPDRTDFGRSAKGRPAFGQNPARNPWPEPDEVPGRPAGTRGGEPSGTDTSGYGGSRDSAGRPPLPGRHSRNASADEPWSPPAQAESSLSPESPSPFSSAPRRVPGATLGNGPGPTLGSGVQDRPDSPVPDAKAMPSPKAWDDAKPWGGRVMEGESPATPGSLAADDAPVATSLSGTASSSGWSGSGWELPTPSPAAAEGPSDTVVSGDAAPGDAAPGDAAPGDDEDDWPTRYSWLEDDETDKPQDSATQTTAASTSEVPESVAVSAASAASAPDENREALEADGAAETADSAGLVTVLPGVPRYHEANCILIRFMPKDDVRTLTIPAAENLGCTPCTACQSQD